MSIPISDLMTENLKETNEAIRKQLNNAVTLINVDDSEKMFLICLLKSTIASEKRGDFYCEKTAKKVIKDHKHILACVGQVAHFHTHNLKMPNPKVSKQRIIAESVELHPKVLTSANIKKSSFGWANNAADINKSRLFLTSFVWQSKEQTLHDLFREKNEFWLELCKSLGMLRKTEKAVIDFINKNPLSLTFPEKVSFYSTQVCFPVDGQDICITPVVSHDVLLEQERLFKDGKASYQWLVHPHPNPQSIGMFIGSAGGNQKVFDQRPKLPKKPRSFHLSKVNKNIHELLNGYALVKQPMRETLKGISRLIRESPLDERKRLYASFETHIDSWLNPVSECRKHLVEESIADLSAKDTLVQSLLTEDNLTDNTIADELFPLLLASLSRNKWTECFAYHPRIIKAAKPILRRSLRKLNAPKALHNTAKIQEYCLHLKKLKISRANALSNPHILGLPSLTALYGFVRRFLLNLYNTFQKPLKIEGISWFLHEYDDYQIYAKPQLKLNKKKNGQVKSGLPPAKWQCDMIMDVVLPLRLSDGGLPYLRNDQILASIPSSFASGSVHLMDEIDIEKNVSIKPLHEVLDELSRLPASGRWVIPTSEQLSTFEIATDKLNENSAYRMVNLGFTLLEDPCIRQDSNKCLHAYAESAFGIVELVNPIEYRKNGMKEFFGRTCWHYNQNKKNICMQQNPEFSN